MADTQDLIVTIPEVDNKAQIVLDWDDGEWYISSIDYTNNANVSTTSDYNSTVDTSGTSVKVAEWSKNYKYIENDIVAFQGNLYVSKQNNNQNNSPDGGTFWWNPLVDLSNINAVTLEGKNYTELVLDVLNGKTIDSFYTKDETDGLLLKYFNNVNAKKLDNWTLADIQNDYETKITNTKVSASDDAKDYFLNEGSGSYQEELLELFDSIIAPEDVNRS